MDKSDFKTESQIPFRTRESETASQIKPHYRVHGGTSGESTAQHPMEASLDSANAMLELERQISVQPMLSFLIPTHNAQQWLPALLEDLLCLQAEKEIIIVDDCSTDGTLAIVKSLREKHSEIVLLRHDIQLGRGAALQTGLSASLGKVVVVLDGISDLENKDVVMLVKPILAGCCDIVYGSHHILSHPDQESHQGRLIDRLLTGMINFCTGQHLSSIESPLKAFRREALDGIRLRKNQRCTDVEMIFRLSRKGRRIYEMPLNSLCDQESGKRSLREQMATVFCLIRHVLHI